MRSQSNSHFLGFRYRSYSSRYRRTSCIISWCVASSVLYIKISSIYIATFPSAIRSAKIVFISIWNVAGELVSSKYMTCGSNNPQLVINTAFH